MSRKWCETKNVASVYRYNQNPERNRTFFLTDEKCDQICMDGRHIERNDIHRKWKENMGLDAPSLKTGFLAKIVLCNLKLGVGVESPPWQAVTLSGWQETE